MASWFKKHGIAVVLGVLFAILIGGTGMALAARSHLPAAAVQTATTSGYYGSSGDNSGHHGGSGSNGNSSSGGNSHNGNTGCYYTCPAPLNGTITSITFVSGSTTIGAIGFQTVSNGASTTIHFTAVTRFDTTTSSSLLTPAAMHVGQTAQVTIFETLSDGSFVASLIRLTP
jgi:hypothetical protein